MSIWKSIGWATIILTCVAVALFFIFGWIYLCVKVSGLFWLLLIPISIALIAFVIYDSDHINDNE